jgi:hypothetical protein
LEAQISKKKWGKKRIEGTLRKLYEILMKSKLMADFGRMQNRKTILSFRWHSN